MTGFLTSTATADARILTRLFSYQPDEGETLCKNPTRECNALPRRGSRMQDVRKAGSKGRSSHPAPVRDPIGAPTEFRSPGTDSPKRHQIRCRNGAGDGSRTRL